MNRSRFQVRILTGALLSALLRVQPIAAQVVPDTTLPVGERSQVTGNPNVQIDGGARRGGNLFHSFSQFSVPTGGSAYFNNAADVQNIFSRITGGAVSNIDGVIRANGTANLFLLNPNGILFGPNASLNIGGSFVATSANSINFADNFQYSATNPQTMLLLTVSVPVGLQMGATPGPIVVQGNGYNLSVSVAILSPTARGNSTAGLQVPAGRTLALIGGNIDIEGGTLTAEQGQIELGSVRSGQVSFSDSFALSYPGIQNFGNIRLSRQALADASGGGSIQVQGNQVSLADGSIMLIQNQGIQAGGSLRVNAFQSLEMSGISPDGGTYGGLIGETVGVGRGADITVSTQQLIAQRGAGTLTRSYSSGDAGNIAVNASDFIQLIGRSLTNPRLASVIGSGAFNSGDGGAVTVSTGQLSLLRGANLSTSTFGNGNAGNVTVNATRAVEIIGVSEFIAQSAINSNSNTAGVGNAGAVTINTARLVLQNGGTANSSTLGSGNGGSVTVNASKFVEISGTVPNSRLFSYVGSAAPIVAESTRRVFQLPDKTSGNAGSVTINTPHLSISDGANATVSSEGTGNSGTLRVNANLIVVDKGSAITAATASGEGGNVNLNVRDLLLLRNNSQITTSAGGSGNGGNIKIDARSIVAVPNENSDIRANSVNARGGNISINASGIFGIQPRPQDTPLSDITATGASSAQGGTVQLNIDRLDPTSGLAELPTTIVDSSRLIAQSCPVNPSSSFVISGRGGLPPTPDQELDDDADWQDRRRLTVTQQPGVRREGTDIRRRGDVPNLTGEASDKTQNHSTPYTPVVEATGWQRTPAGEIILVANTSNSAVQNSLNYPNTCQRR
ncbi:MAG: filamentous hemagglutinin N-terminal domain-containing protein [Plectolyngbya sp. WJT66-NPBG17]|jgi:filamentous hemagglutinin family protein|nr:filamentous hemagglutinin N-terminal domain-containing protein [Plectolyngbya sp. WJT66-NPBG17]